MRKRFLLLLLPVALPLAAWIGPRLFDWESQRDRVAAIASARLGRMVTVEGPLRVTLLPQPMLEADDVRVGEEDGETLGVSARVLRLRLGLVPLLSGRLEPRDLVLVGADIRLPWPPESIGALRPPPWLTGFDARVEDSRVEVGGAVLEGVSARPMPSAPRAASPGAARPRASRQCWAVPASMASPRSTCRWRRRAPMCRRGARWSPKAVSRAVSRPPAATLVC